MDSSKMQSGISEPDRCSSLDMSAQEARERIIRSALLLCGPEVVQKVPPPPRGGLASWQANRVGTREPLSQIALARGLCDQPQFTRLFRRIVGESPGAWRRQFMTEMWKP